MTSGNEPLSLRDLQSPDPYRRLLAIRAIGQGALQDERVVLGGGSATDALRQALEDTETLVRNQAAFEIGERGYAEDIPVLADRLNRETERDVRLNIVGALGAIGGAEARHLLRQAMQNDSDLDVRLEAVRMFGRLAAQPQRVVLGESSGDSPREVLEMLAGGEETPALRRAASIELRKLTREDGR